MHLGTNAVKNVNRIKLKKKNEPVISNLGLAAARMSQTKLAGMRSP